MNKRTINMVHELMKRDGKGTVSELADQFQVSQRTIRNDIKVINELLESNGFQEMELKRGGNIICGKDFEHILSLVSEDDFYIYKLSKAERKKIASAMLINSSGYLTISAIADSLFVSRATIINDLDGIKAYIKKGNLEVISHPNKGLRIEGQESDKRQFLMKIAMTKDGKNAQDIVSRQISIQAGNRIVIQKIITEQEHVHKSYLTDGSFQRILLYLGIMVNRNMQGEYMEVRKKSHNHRHLMAQDIIRYVAQYCDIQTTEDEAEYLSELLARSRYMKQKSQERNAVKIQMITRRFIYSISEELEINLNTDYDFFENLSNHLESVFSINPVDYAPNPVIDEVLENNPHVLAAVNEKIPIIRQYVGREITDIEIGYIAVHICAAIERKKNKEIAFHVILVCHAGIGTSRLLLEKLKKHFNFQIVDIISSHEAKELEQGAADFIISTVTLKDCKLDHVVVSPLLNDEDYIRVGNKIDALRNSRNLPSRIEEKEISAKGLMDKISPIVWQMAPEQAPGMLKMIRRVVRDYMNQPIEEESEIISPYLHHLLPASHIELEVECSDWKEAIRKSAQKLLDLGYIEQRYIDAMIQNVEENGPYIVLLPGFAMPHEGPDMGTIRVGMNMIRLKESICFGSEEFDPVEFVCCLSAVDQKTHLKAFFNLVNIMQKPEFKEELRQAKTEQDVAWIIEKYEYNIIN
ncbi:MAG: BglG family transcription antiterminator [Lachnospiraceae bacterium]|nr:BglG family transcription antiterminator [Lachnospiraceae bacterium]